MMEKKYVDSNTAATDAVPQIDTETETIHDIFCIVNVMVLDGMAVSYQSAILPHEMNDIQVKLVLTPHFG